MTVSALILFFMFPLVGLQCVIVTFPGYTYLLTCYVPMLIGRPTFQYFTCKLFELAARQSLEEGKIS